NGVIPALDVATRRAERGPPVALELVVDEGGHRRAVARVERPEPGAVVEGGRVVALGAAVDHPAVDPKVLEIGADEAAIDEMRRKEMAPARSVAEGSRRCIGNVVLLAAVGRGAEDDRLLAGDAHHKFRLGGQGNRDVQQSAGQGEQWSATSRY